MSLEHRVLDYLAAVRIVGPLRCWRLPNRPNSNGHIQLKIDGRLYLAHRLMYAALVSVIPHGHVVDHLCRRRWCCNPSHLEPVTPCVNTLRGGSPSAVNARKTHCRRGHPLVAVTSRGRRRCETCRRTRRYTGASRHPQLAQESR